MPIIELYSTRQQKLPDTYSYDLVPNKLRAQLFKIFSDSIGYRMTHMSSKTPAQIIYEKAFDALSKEYGVLELHGYRSGCLDWMKYSFMYESYTLYFLDLIEVFCTLLLNDVKPNFTLFEKTSGVKQSPDDAIEEVNARMRISGFGYEYLEGILVRIDQDYLHTEVTKPALYLLTDFEGAKGEFLKAHEHYRHGRYEECLVDCNKSLESLLKTICDARGWKYKKEKATVNSLVIVCMNEGLFPKYLQTEISSLSAVISQGVSTIRNNAAGHGSGSSIRETPVHLVSYAIQLTASNIVFLSKCFSDLSKN